MIREKKDNLTHLNSHYFLWVLDIYATFYEFNIKVRKKVSLLVKKNLIYRRTKLII